MSNEDLTHAFQQVCAQLDLDKHWHDEVAKVIFDHAEQIDQMHGSMLRFRVDHSNLYTELVQV